MRDLNKHNLSSISDEQIASGWLELLRLLELARHSLKEAIQLQPTLDQGRQLLESLNTQIKEKLRLVDDMVAAATSAEEACKEHHQAILEPKAQVDRCLGRAATILVETKEIHKSITLSERRIKGVLDRLGGLVKLQASLERIDQLESTLATMARRLRTTTILGLGGIVITFFSSGVLWLLVR